MPVDLRAARSMRYHDGVTHVDNSSVGFDPRALLVELFELNQPGDTELPLDLLLRMYRGKLKTVSFAWMRLVVDDVYILRESMPENVNQLSSQQDSFSRFRGPWPDFTDWLLSWSDKLTEAEDCLLMDYRMLSVFRIKTEREYRFYRGDQILGMLIALWYAADRGLEQNRADVFARCQAFGEEFQSYLPALKTAAQA